MHNEYENAEQLQLELKSLLQQVAEPVKPTREKRYLLN